MRLISAAPRGVAANCRSSATVVGRRLTIASKRSKRVCIGEGQDLVVHRAGPLRQRGQQIGRGNQHGARRGHAGQYISGYLVI